MTIKRFLIRGALAIAALSKTLAMAGPITIPAGLNPGDPYRYVFVTSAIRDALSTNIADYNNFVNGVANAPGSMLQPLGATWFAIGSTQAITAALNIGGPSTVPIYRPDGLLVATGTADLWDGSLLNTIVLNEQFAVNYNSIWSGTQADGSQYGGIWFLGSPLPGYGVNYLADWRWIDYSRAAPTDERPFYGISNTLYVPGDVPEPSALVLTICGFALMALRRR